MSQLQDKYRKEVVPTLMKQLGAKNVMEVPKVEKVVVSVCIGEAVKNPKLLNTAVDELTVITGQKAQITKAKKAIANFKLRAGMPLGASVTLRNEKMYIFLEKLIHFSIPRVSDFRGLSPKAFDGRGNYNMGLKEQIVFPEVNYDKVDKVRGMNITICTSSPTDAGGKALLEAMGMPFKKS